MTITLDRSGQFQRPMYRFTSTNRSRSTGRAKCRWIVHPVCPDRQREQYSRPGSDGAMMLGNWHKLARMLPIMAPRMGTRSLLIVAMHTNQCRYSVRFSCPGPHNQCSCVRAGAATRGACATAGQTLMAQLCRLLFAHVMRTGMGGVHTHAHHRRVALGYWECATGTARLQAARAQWGACRCTQMNRWCVLKVRASNSGCGEQISLRRCCWPLPLPPVPTTDTPGPQTRLEEHPRGSWEQEAERRQQECGLRFPSPVGVPAVLGIGS
jgi:hypothetical protein